MTTNQSLDKLYRKDLILFVLFLQNQLAEANNSKTDLPDEIRKLNDKFDQLHSDVCITKMLLTYFEVGLVTSNVNVGKMASIHGENA